MQAAATAFLPEDAAGAVLLLPRLLLGLAVAYVVARVLPVIINLIQPPPPGSYVLPVPGSADGGKWGVFFMALPACVLTFASFDTAQPVLNLQYGTKADAFGRLIAACFLPTAINTLVCSILHLRPGLKARGQLAVAKVWWIAEYLIVGIVARSIQTTDLLPTASADGGDVASRIRAYQVGVTSVLVLAATVFAVWPREEW